ncbi:hypothetical protein K432DRAFT_393129 [Lepidopterella palustris CBS 459.81]|uniref:Uncharacterized protein n=1 Tax=Lepidopterella palustris CBS 459.81 TaxID=1314670 RepID=A0A8E2EAS9_9PEZI|nr:hypothetical protein K432DRAFT_393129 [Lepidopterella palustris CBS 459.81]
MQNGFSQDKLGISSRPVHKDLAQSSKPRYEEMMAIWETYEAKYPGSDPRGMIDMKHFTEFVALPNKRKYIKDTLQKTVPLSAEEKPQTLLTIENYVHIQTQCWQADHHNYIHEGVRVYQSNMLTMHCFSSATLQEVCNSTCKGNELEIKVSFKREYAKGMQDTLKKPKHPLYERLDPIPPLFANSILLLLSIFLAADAFRDYKPIFEVLNAKPPPGEKFWIMEWEERVLDLPLYSEMTRTGPTKKAKSKFAWSKQYSDWAKRAEFVGGMGLHAPRREALIKVDDNGYSLGQRKLGDDELKNHQRNYRRVYNVQNKAHGDSRRSYFDRVIRHMVPERGRLADTLALAVPIRSPQGISALEDLLALLKNDSSVAYQEGSFAVFNIASWQNLLKIKERLWTQNWSL